MGRTDEAMLFPAVQSGSWRMLEAVIGGRRIAVTPPKVQRMRDLAQVGSR